MSFVTSSGLDQRPVLVTSYQQLLPSFSKHGVVTNAACWRSRLRFLLCHQKVCVLRVTAGTVRERVT
jgi:hypothetical protein